MASEKTIIESITILRSNGVQGGPSGRTGLEVAIQTWMATLQDVSDEDLTAATYSFLRDPAVCQFWPQPGIILAHLPGAKAEAQDTADEAWGRVKRALTIKGRGYPPGVVVTAPRAHQMEDGRWESRMVEVTWNWDPARGDHEAIRAALDVCGGWVELSLNLTADTEPSLRKSFRDAYRANLQRRKALAKDATHAGLLGLQAQGLRLLPGGGQ